MDGTFGHSASGIYWQVAFLADRLLFALDLSISILCANDALQGLGTFPMILNEIRLETFWA